MVGLRRVDVEPGLRQQLAQPFQTREHSALDRPEREAEPLRELGLREAAVVGELDRLALVGRELAQRLLDDLALRAEPGLFVGRLARGLLGVVERVGSPALLAADEVDGPSVDERQDPGARLALFGKERAGRAPDGEEPY